MRNLKLSIANYLNHCQNVRRLSEHTLRAYASDLALFSALTTSRRAASASSIRKCLTVLAEDRNVAPATARRRFASVRAFLRSTDEKLAAKIFGGWKLSIRAPVRLPKAMAKRELGVLLGDASRGAAPGIGGGDTTHLCISLMAATGLRVSEMCGLKLGDVRLETGEIQVFGKGARERVVVIVNSQVRQALLRHMRALPEPRGSDAPLFRNRRGRPLSPQCFRLRLRALARRRGLEKPVTPHMLRHTAATLLLEGGVDTRFVQRLLGHASIATTQIYTHVSDVALRSALARADVMRGLL